MQKMVKFTVCRSTVTPIDNEDVTKDAKTAEKALKALAPSIIGEYKENGDSLSRYVNGVRVDCDDAYAYTDKNGKLVSYSVNYTTNAEFRHLTMQ